MFCPTDRIARAADVSFRPIPEWRRALAYTPRRPGLAELDATAWLVFELCDGRSLAAITDEFAESLPHGTPPETASALLHAGLAGLIEARLIEVRA